MSKPRWRPDLQAELDCHHAIGMKAEHLAAQVDGLAMSLHTVLGGDARMRRYAETIISEARDALPYGKRRPDGYWTRRQQLGRRTATGRPRQFIPDAIDVEMLTDRWGDTLVNSLTVAVWVVRRLVRLHDLRYGAYVSPYAAGFQADDHQGAVADMQRTLLGNRPAQRRYVRAWRPDHV